MIVIDTNVIAALILPTSLSFAAAENLLRADRDWVAPVLWRSEFTNILVTATRNGWLDLDQAFEALEAAEELMADGDYSVPASDVLQTAATAGCTAYDTEFVVLARDLGTRLVTLDQQILRAFPELAIPLDTFEPEGAA